MNSVSAAHIEVMLPTLIAEGGGVRARASARVGAWAWDRGKGACLLSPFLAGTTPSFDCLVLLLLVTGILLSASFLNNYFFSKKKKTLKNIIHQRFDNVSVFIKVREY